MSQAFDLCFSNQHRAEIPVDTSDINQVRVFRKNNPHIMGNFIPAGTPFVISQSNAASKVTARPDISCALNTVINWSQQTQRNVAHMNQVFGDEQLYAVAQVYEREIQPYINTAREMTAGHVDSLTALGAGATAVNAKEKKLSKFGQAIYKYQKALIEVHHAAKGKANKTTLIQLGRKVQQAHVELNKDFARELKNFSGAVKARKRGNVWSNPNRGINIAKGARNTSRLELTSLSGIRSIKALEHASDIAGKGIIALDAGIRMDNVYTDYQAGKDWQRTAVVETTGFGLGTMAGIAAGTFAVEAGIGIALAATPVGWVILIGVGIGAGYAAGKMGDFLGKNFAGSVYDTSKSISWF